MTDRLLFLGYLVSDENIEVAEVKYVQECLIPKTVTELQSFFGLASFYQCFFKGFSTIIAPLSDYLKKGRFLWTPEVEQAFHYSKNG